MISLQKQYETDGKKMLAKKLNIINSMAIPKLLKISINIGLGEALEDKKVIETAGKQMAVIAGQKPVVTHAKKDISAFKVRKGDPVGLKVTIRGKRMYDFLEKFIKIVLPRIRDFRGISATGFDGRGSYTVGLTEQIVFPEIEYSQIDKVRGLEITFVTSGKNKEEARSLMDVLGMPFTKKR